jgi:hypothetical protein
MAGGGFADVERCSGGLLLCITVQAPTATDAQFAALARAARLAYERMRPDFELVLDLTRLGVLAPHHAQAWMQLFDEVRPITRERLRCTHIVIANAAVRLGLDLFLGLYDPIRPVHVHPDRASCLRAVGAARSKEVPVDGEVVEEHVRGRRE